jgi:4-hydroxybutyrate CoA-transferase
VADSIGTRQYSGVGGQMDFIRGAALSQDGRPIIALPSTTRQGESRIVPLLRPGAGVVTTRAHVHFVVTEYGVANLYGLSLRQRARALIDVSHPDHRETLERAARERFGTLPQSRR